MNFGAYTHSQLFSQSLSLIISSERKMLYHKQSPMFLLSSTRYTHKRKSVSSSYGKGHNVQSES